MNKLLLGMSMLLVLGTSGYAIEGKSESPKKTQEVVEVNWWEQAGKAGSEYWWIYVDEQSE